MQSFIFLISEIRNYVVQRTMVMMLIFVNFVTSVVFSVRQACDNAKKRNRRFLESRRNSRLVLPVHQRQNQKAHYRNVSGAGGAQLAYGRTEAMIRMGEWNQKNWIRWFFLIIIAAEFIYVYFKGPTLFELIINVSFKLCTNENS